MKYDFTSILDRRGKDAAAYDNVGAHVIAPARPKEGIDIIPMWVADMNFLWSPPSQRRLSPGLSTLPSGTSFPPTNTMIPSSSGTRSATVSLA